MGNLAQDHIVNKRKSLATVSWRAPMKRGLATGKSHHQSLPTKTASLAMVSDALDNSHLTAKQYSFRLPVHVAAKLAALEQLDPTRTRTQLVGDLLTAAISEVEKNLDSFPGAFSGEMDPETDDEMFYETGPLADYRRFANQYFQDLEKELGNKHPTLLFGGEYLVGADRR
jgi:hypothetical protein